MRSAAALFVTLPPIWAMVSGSACASITRASSVFVAESQNSRYSVICPADRTAGLARDPAPKVLQTALQDFYVEYTLLVTVQDPSKKYLVLSELNGNIQDAFNEHGVQIMSPNYEADPAAPKLVPREKWFQPPAAP